RSCLISKQMMTTTLKNTANTDTASFVCKLFILETWEAIRCKFILLPTQSKFYIYSNDKSSPVMAALN
ncbi:hypothetical protein AB6E08_21770, partial [Vibrio sp. 10N.247.310.24]|uniref:hypothetical protein n=1 Tax=Vibrio sp. 10N.247.310.24 TaxID=3229984 RepID=UPI00355340A4